MANASMSDDDLNALLSQWSQEADASGSDFTAALAQLETTVGGGGKSWGGGGKSKGKAPSWGGGKDSGGWGGGKDKGGKGKGDKGKGKGGGKGKAAMRVANGDVVYFGKVKTYDAEKKRGYIVSEEIFNSSGMDVYVFGNVLEPSGGGPGDTVAFFVHWSAAGQPQASAPMIRVASPEGFALKGIFKPGQPGKNGFLICDTTKEYFGRDVYVPLDKCGGLEAGAAVAFNAYFNRDKMPNAESVEIVDPAWEPVPSDLSFTRTDPNVLSNASKGGGKGKGGGMDGGKGGKGGGAGKGGKGKEAIMAQMMELMGQFMGGDDGGGDSWGGAGKGGCKGGAKGKSAGGGKPGPAPTPTGETFYGVIKSFNDTNNYGFIASEDVQSKYNGVDCFFNGKFAGQISVGDMVEFDVGLNQKGQPQATGIRTLDGGSDPAAKKQKLA